MKRTLFTFAAAALSLAQPSLAREVGDFCDGWEFAKDGENYRAVDVPHDWAIEGPFIPDGDPGTGKLPWRGVGWYRNGIVLQSAPEGKRIFLDFDGVMCDGTVYVNGQPCAHQPYGYLGMRADITPYLFAGTNSITVKADTTKLSSRWYPGAGIYRRVRKIETDEVYIEDRDVFVSPQAVKNSGGRAWEVHVSGAVASRRPQDTHVKIIVTLRAPDGEVVATSEDETNVVPCGSSRFSVCLSAHNPNLWEMKPNAARYTAEITIVAEDGRIRDNVTVKTGFRDFIFDADRGFFLNDRRVQLKGVCLHSDLGILGMAFNKSAMRRELVALMDMGVNAIRTAHNPPAPELLDLCDELGLFVWDECFDKWNGTCGRGDEPLEEYVAEKLSEFVRRDRNHPSVFVWSIGNEISPGRACPPGQEHWASHESLGTSAERCATFRNVIRSLDPTRPVGIASCFEEAAPKGDYAPLDITGWNYAEKYNAMRRVHPDKPVLYTESASALSEYGHYAANLPQEKTAYDFANIRVDSYDRNAAPWSDIADREFERMERDIFVGGEFVWTGVDYLGEPTPYGWNPIGGRNVPHGELARSSYFGIFDLLVLPKDRAWLYRSHWNKDAFTLHVVPDHWNFGEDASAPVYVYSSADEVELFLNGKSLGSRRKNPEASSTDGYYGVMPRYRLAWDDVKYIPGELRAVAYGKDGAVLGEKVVHTAGEAAHVVLRAESDTLGADRREYVFVEVSLADANGVRVPRDMRRVSFKVEGPGEIVSVGNSDPRALVSFKLVASHPLYNGRAGLFIRRTGPGKVRLVASSPNLESAAIEFHARDAQDLSSPGNVRYTRMGH